MSSAPLCDGSSVYFSTISFRNSGLSMNEHGARRSSLKEILLSDFFKEARGRAPFHTDRRAPCSFIDSPDFLKEMVEKYDLKPTHDGAESIVGELHEPLMEMSQKYKRMLAELSEEEAREEAAAK